jgi:hypothetical protein
MANQMVMDLKGTNELLLMLNVLLVLEFDF